MTSIRPVSTRFQETFTCSSAECKAIIAIAALVTAATLAYFTSGWIACVAVTALAISGLSLCILISLLGQIGNPLSRM